MVICILAGCSSGYNIDNYPDLASLNSQVAEQRNSVLNRVKATLSCQHQENFFQSLRTFLSFRNTLHILELRDPINESERLLKSLSVLYK